MLQPFESGVVLSCATRTQLQMLANIYFFVITTWPKYVTFFNIFNRKSFTQPLDHTKKIKKNRKSNKWERERHFMYVIMNCTKNAVIVPTVVSHVRTITWEASNSWWNLFTSSSRTFSPRLLWGLHDFPLSEYTKWHNANSSNYIINSKRWFFTKNENRSSWKWR